jgi:hypothetical protein
LFVCVWDGRRGEEDEDEGAAAAAAGQDKGFLGWFGQGGNSIDGYNLFSFSSFGSVARV